MATLGDKNSGLSLGQAASEALQDFGTRVVVSTEVPPAARDPQAAFVRELHALEKAAGGKKQAAAAAGVSISNWNRWLAGTRHPRGASRENIRSRYEALRRPALVKRRRTIAAKKLLKNVRIQISGTAQISRDKRYRSNFAEDDLHHLDLSDTWDIRMRPALLHDPFEQAIQDATGIDVTWPYNDVVVIIL